MARFIQNNFGGGEISPVLYGRSDLKAYYSGFARAVNFVVSKEGSLRKRHGIASHLSLASLGAYSNAKIVPYRYDRTNGGFLLLSYSGGLTIRFYTKDFSLKGTATDDTFLGDVKKIQHKQIGDQVWLTNGAWSRIVTVTNNESIAVSSWQQATKPSKPSSFSTVGKDKDGNNYDGDGETAVHYCAFIVTDGVNSDLIKTSAWQKKSWVAGDYVNCTVTLTADQRDTMDYVCIGKSNGGKCNYGELARFYKEDFTEEGKLYLTFVDKNVSPGSAIYSQTNVIGDGTFLPLCVDCFQQRKVFANRAGTVTRTTHTLTTAASSYTPPDGISNLVSVKNSSNQDVTDDFTVYNGVITRNLCEAAERLYTIAYEADYEHYTVTLSEAASRYTIPAEQQTGNLHFESATCDGESYPESTADVNTYTIIIKEHPKDLYTFTYDGLEEGALPMTLWFSEVGNLDNFYADRPVAEDDPFSPTIASTGPAFIRWIVTYNEMMVIFTDCGLFSVGFSQTQGFGPSSCRISRFSNIAVSPNVQPIVTDAGVVFVGADEKTLYTAAYDIQENALKPVNRSVLVEHLTRTAKIRAIALQEFPNSVVWVVLDDGRMATFTFERNEEVFAWAEAEITSASVLDAVSLGTVTDTSSASSSAERTYSDLLFVVSKNGTEYLCSNATDWADNIGGTDANAQNVAATLVTLRPESQERTLVGRRKNAKDVILRLYETGSVSVRPHDGRSPDLPLVPAATGTSSLFSGEVKVMPRGCIDENGQMEFVSDDQHPCEILQIVTDMEVA